MADTNSRSPAFGQIGQSTLDRLRGASVRRRAPAAKAEGRPSPIEQARERLLSARNGTLSVLTAADRKLFADLTEAVRENTATLRRVYDLGPAEGSDGGEDEEGAVEGDEETDEEDGEEASEEADG